MNESAKAFSSSDFPLGAEVNSSDGKVVGELKRLLVGDPDYRLQGLVVKEGNRFSGLLLSPGAALLADEVIVPADAVAGVSHDRIDLKLASEDVRRLPPYLSFRARTETTSDELADEAAVLGQSPGIPRSMEEVANKPAGELEIEGGENVMLGHTGKKLGTVEDVVFDEGQLVGVVLRPEGWFKRNVILPRRFLDRSDDLALFANLTEDDLEHLEPFEPAQ